MSEVLFVRTGNKIKDLKADTTEVYKSINLAKKASISLQVANGGLGGGSLVAYK